MQRVSSLLPTWERTRSVDGKASGGAFGKVFGWTDKIASPHRLSISSSSSQTQRTNAAAGTTNGKTGREEYWPSSLDKECEKAARILKSFTTDGFLSYEPSLSESSEPPSPTSASSRHESTQIQIMKKIPPRIVQNAVGLAIFSCMRSGLWMSGSGGSGILIARKADGTWSPPSGIMLHTAGLGFAIGVDIYDCVLVINSLAALELFTKPRLVLGTDVSLSVGPVVGVDTKANFDSARWKELSNTVMTYLKARGQHQAVRLDGSMVTERGNENERFYGTSVEVVDILADNVRKSIPEIAPLFEAIKAAEGRSDADPRIMQALSLQPAPGDANIETTPSASPATPISAKFGVPNSDDPDPYGVIALEMAGLEIREAGSRLRPTSTQFDYAPSPTAATFNHSSIHNSNPHSTFHRQSVDTYASRSNSNRGSVMSSRTQATTMTDAFTQTDVGESARASPSPTRGQDEKSRRESETRPVVTEPEEIDYTKVDMSSLVQHLKRDSVDLGPASAPAEIPASKPEEVEAPLPKSISEVQLPKRQDTDATQATVKPAKPATEDTDIPLSPGSESDEDADDEDEDDEDEEEPVIFEMATAAQPVRTAIMRPQQATQVIQAKGALVTIHKRPPPALPPRNPARSSRASKSDFGTDVSSLKSPVRSSFESCASSFPQSADGEEPITPSAGATDATHLTSDEAASQSGNGPVVGTSTDANKSYHHRNSSSVQTTILPDSSSPAVPNPTTPRATVSTTTDESKSSSATMPDDDSTSTSTPEPRTPKVFEDFLSHRSKNNDDKVVGKTEMSTGHLSSATIQVA